MNRKMSVFFLLLFLLPTGLLPAKSQAQDVIVVESKGVGDIYAGRKARARDVAVEDALRRAVEQAVGMFLSSETIVQNGDILKDSIYSRSKGYIQKYVILEEAEKGKLYTVTVEAHVVTTKLQDDLLAIGLLMSRKHKPRIMVVIPEYRINRRIPDPAGETEIIKRLLEKGFKVVDQHQVCKIRYNDRVRAAIDGNTDLAAKIGLEHGAEVIIIGEAFSEYAGRIYDTLESCRARMEARAIRVDTGEILAVGAEHAAGLDITRALAGKKAIEKAGHQLVEYLIGQLLAKWSREVTNITSIDLVITGLNYKQFIEFKSLLLESVRGVRAIHQRSFTNNRAVVEVEIRGDAETLSEEITRTNFKDYKVQITDFSANRLSVNVHSGR